MTDPWNDDSDMTDEGLYVNFSDEEASSESRDMEPLPTGKYLCSIADVVLKESQSDKNKGKPMYNFTFKVVGDKAGGKYTDRQAYALAMLWSPALFTITHIMKACGFPVSGGKVRIPRPEEFMGKLLVVGGILNPAPKNKVTGEIYSPRFEPKSFFHPDKWTQASAGVVTGKTAASASPQSLLS